MNRSKSFLIAFLGVMLALIFSLLYLETLLTLWIGISSAILSLPIALALSMYKDFKYSFIGMTLFGICSFILSFILGYVIFQNPLISVLPRIVVGVLAYLILVGVTKLFSKFIKNEKVRERVSLHVATFFAVVLHTAIVLFAIDHSASYFETTFKTIFAFNFLFELLASVIFVPSLCMALRRVDKTYKGNKVKTQGIESEEEIKESTESQEIEVKENTEN